jgi:hypothetical protein
MPQALAAALVQVFLQGVAWGTFGEAQAKLEGVCSPPDATKTPSRLDVWPCLAITSGAAHFLCAPFAAVLVQRKIKNADVQMIALATASCYSDSRPGHCLPTITALSRMAG